MPYTKEDLEKLDVKELKSITTRILSHLLTLPDDENTGTAMVRGKKRVALAKKEGKEDYIFNQNKYNPLAAPKKKSFLIDKILKVQGETPIGKYASEGVMDFKAMMEEETPKEEKPKVKQQIAIEGAEPGATEGTAEPEKKEEAEAPKPKAKPTREETKRNRFADDVVQFDDLMEQIKKAKDQYSRAEITQQMLELLKELQSNVIMKDKETVSTMREKITEFANIIKQDISNDVYSPEELKTMKTGMAGLSRELPSGKAEMQQLVQLFIDKEEAKPVPSYESTEMNPPSEMKQNEPFMQGRGDKDIGNVRGIGFLAPMEALAKEDDVILQDTERSKSIRRFTDFRWVNSIQNSKLGYASPFQRMDDIDSRRRYGKCFIPTNKMPSDPDTPEELARMKQFNTYPLVPSFGMSSIAQPATEFSFKTSSSPFARKITKDEKQFANKKLYNFEGDGRQNINPHNPFASSYGMEPYSQEVRNANLVNNTLEFSSILYSDDPLMRIKQKHKKNIIS
jgi:hypothetical protein